MVGGAGEGGIFLENKPHRLTFKRGQNISFGRILYFRLCKKKTKKNTSVKTVQNEPLCCCAKRETNSNFRLRVGRLTTRVTWCSNPCNLRNRRKKRVSLRGVEAWRRGGSALEKLKLSDTS